MTPVYTNHLSEEALNDVLIDLGSPESEAHLAVCPDCRLRVKAFRSDMALLNAASLAWSESRPAGLRAATPKTVHRTRLAFVTWAATAVALMVMAFAIWHHKGQPAPPTQATVTTTQPSDTEAQIAQDNQLLQAVNAAISPDVESPIDEFRLPRPHQAHMKIHVR
jgi:anti-sigma factor RsiW